jgi:ADP-heptose:LPS heptosyltransferase
VKDSFLKHVEIRFRKGLIRLLGIFVSRRTPLPPSFDFQYCKIIFIRQDRIGDVLVSTPLFAAVKRRYPDAVIDVLMSTKNHFVLHNNSAVRKRWIYDKHNLRASLAMIRSVRRERYDFAVDLMDNPSATSTILCLLAGARWNVGIEKNNSFVYDITVPMLSRKETHIVDRLAQLLRVFRIDPDIERLTVRYTPGAEARRFAKEAFQRLHLDFSTVIGVNISAGGAVRYWGTEHFRLLLNYLRTMYSVFPVLVLCTPADTLLGEDIVFGIPGTALSPVTETFDQFAALIQGVSFLITPDTSAVHLAAALNIPAVVLYVQSNKELRIWEPYGTPSETLVTDIDDLSTIPLEQVTSAVDRLLLKTLLKHS